MDNLWWTALAGFLGGMLGSRLYIIFQRREKKPKLPDFHYKPHGIRPECTSKCVHQIGNQRYAPGVIPGQIPVRKHGHGMKPPPRPRG